MKKTLLVLSIVLMAAACNNSSQSGPSPDQSTQKTSQGNAAAPATAAEWLTYTNDQFGFQFSYPEPIDPVIRSRFKPSSTSYYNSEEGGEVGGNFLLSDLDQTAMDEQKGVLLDDANFHIDITPKTSSRYQMENPADPLFADLKTTTITKTVINGVPATIAHYKDLSSTARIQEEMQTVFIIGGSSYDFHMDAHGPISAQHIALYNQIVQTIKFRMP